MEKWPILCEHQAGFAATQPLAGAGFVRIESAILLTMPVPHLI
jgi:hypothetical protein